MKSDKIKIIRLPLANYAVMLICVKSQFFHAFHALKALGFEYWFTIKRIKARFVLGCILMHNANFIPVGGKGNLRFIS